MESSSPTNRSIMPPTHARSQSTNLPRLSSAQSRIPLSPTRTSTNTPGLIELTENYRYSGPPPPYNGVIAQAHSALSTVTQAPINNNFGGSKFANSGDMDAIKMPPPGKIPTPSMKQRSMSINNTETSKRETLAERAGRPSGIPSARSTVTGGISKPGSRSTSTAPGTASRHSSVPRPKSSMERVRPPSFSGTNGAFFRTSQSKPSSVSGGSRPPSAQEMRSSSAVEDESDSANVQLWQQMQQRLVELEEKFRKDQEEKEKNAVNNSSDSWKEKYEAERIKVMELETARAGIESQLSFGKMELEQTKQNVLALQHALEEERRDRRSEKDEATRRLDREVEEIKRRARDEIDSLTRSHREAMESVERNAREAQESEIRRLKQELEDEKASRRREVSEIQTQAALEKQKLETKMDSKWREIRQMKEELESVGRELERERLMNGGLRDSLAEHSSASLSMETTTRALKARMELLENDSKEKLLRMQELEEKTRFAEEQVFVTKEKLRAEETLRRKLHNQVQELKGNIRVFCRVRPTHDHEIDKADIKFPDMDNDAREIEVAGKERTATGNVLEKKHPFQFDRVFGPTCKNQDVFEEISQLVQSALDGYNVCIFCYGQTGSGKTFTMSSKDGMIPRAVAQIYETATSLQEKGWKYIMEGSFVEVYNENINDLLGRADDLDKKKHEIRHDKEAQKTTVTGLTSVVLDAPDKVEQLLRTADGNRSVAATKANERSSRSHSVFMLKLTGVNSITGEKSEGTLNLVDLAGSERISHSQVTGERLRETQSINKSLACLGDVIQALGNGEKGAHIPYRNSKLTYLLQYSLGGNSKTLMFVMVSPLLGHMSETLTSLKFATKVNNTSIGTAKKATTSRG